MKFVSARELRINPGKVWKRLTPDEPLVVTNNGKPIALLCGTDAASLESALDEWRHVRFLKALRASQQAALESGTSSLSMKEIDKEIALSRKKRRKSP